MKLFKKIIGIYQILISLGALALLAVIVYLNMSPLEGNVIKDNFLTAGYSVLMVIGGFLIFQVLFGGYSGIKAFRKKGKENFASVTGYFSSVVATILLLAGGVIAATFSPKANPGDTHKKIFLPINSAAPEISGYNIHSDPIKLTDFKGRYVFLEFWGSWCIPCLNGLPKVQELSDQMDENNLVVVGIIFDENLDKAKNYLERNNYTFPQIIDSSQQVIGDYKIESIPHNYLINPEGVIIAQDIPSDELLEVVPGMIGE